MSKPVVYIVLYSLYHHVYKLSLSIKEGLEAKGVDVQLFQVAETLSEEILGKMQAPVKPDLPIMTVDKMCEPDGIIFGLPTRFGTMPTQIKSLLDASGALWAKGSLAGKFAGTFFCTASQHGGQETTALTAVTYFSHHGMLYVPFGFANAALYNIDEVVGGSAYGSGTVAGGDGSRLPTELELGISKNQGENFGAIVSTFVKGRNLLGQVNVSNKSAAVDGKGGDTTNTGIDSTTTDTAPPTTGAAPTSTVTNPTASNTAAVGTGATIAGAVGAGAAALAASKPGQTVVNAVKSGQGALGDSASALAASKPGQTVVNAVKSGQDALGDGTSALAASKPGQTVINAGSGALNAVKSGQKALGDSAASAGAAITGKADTAGIQATADTAATGDAKDANITTTGQNATDAGAASTGNATTEGITKADSRADPSKIGASAGATAAAAASAVPNKLKENKPKKKKWFCCG